MSALAEAPAWPLRVVLVGAVPTARRGTAAEFRHQGIALSRPADALAALREIGREPGSIVVVAAGLCDMDAGDFIEIVAALAHSTVLLGVDADTSAETIAAHLGRGASGCVTLPLTPSRLAVAVRPQRAAPAAAVDVDLRTGPITLRPGAHRVFVGQAEVNLSPKEFDVLHYLMRASPRLVGIDELVREFADGNAERVMRMRIVIYRTRVKLGEAAPGAGPVIQTVRGVGYRLVDEWPGGPSDIGTTPGQVHFSQ
jgi:DNA-binding response OmpR family regulator